MRLIGMWPSNGDLERHVGLGTRCPLANRNKPDRPPLPRAARGDEMRGCHASTAIDRSVVRSGTPLHTREVAGSKPAAPHRPQGPSELAHPVGLAARGRREYL